MLAEQRRRELDQDAQSLRAKLNPEELRYFVAQLFPNLRRDINIRGLASGGYVVGQSLCVECGRPL